MTFVINGCVMYTCFAFLVLPRMEPIAQNIFTYLWIIAWIYTTLFLPSLSSTCIIWNACSDSQTIHTRYNNSRQFFWCVGV